MKTYRVNMTVSFTVDVEDTDTIENVIDNIEVEDTTNHADVYLQQIEDYDVEALPQTQLCQGASGSASDAGSYSG